MSICKMYIHHYKLSTHGCNIVAKKGMEWPKLDDLFCDHLVGWALIVDKHKQLKHKN